jgi:hypothetical protein
MTYVTVKFDKGQQSKRIYAIVKMAYLPQNLFTLTQV